MKIICTVQEFGRLVRGCHKNGCYNCPLADVCFGTENEGIGIERFISAADVIEEAKESEAGQ